MYIFISYASEYRAIAERISIGLKQDNHDVFFDRKELEPGLSYDQKIRKSINKVDLFIFLVSPESVSRKSYALTELSIAHDRWDIPDNKILPVLVKDIDWNMLPPYLSSISVLQAEGNLVAEVLNRVDKISEPGFTNRVIVPLLSRLNQLGKIDYLYLFFIGVITLIGWLGYGSANFNNQEKLAWSFFILIAVFVWFTSRLIINLYKKDDPSFKKKTALICSVIIIIILGLVLKFVKTYQIQVFLDDEIGIYVSRFKGDPLDKYQDKLSDEIKDQVSDLLNDNIYGIKVRKLPRRLESDFDAQQYGQQGQSHLVLWDSESQIDCKDNGVECNTLQITLIKTRKLKTQTGWTIYDTLPKYISPNAFGHIHKYDLHTAIVEFLLGYYLFTSFDDQANEAMKHLSNSLKALDAGQNETVSLPFKASILFYLGNAQLECYLSSTDPITECTLDSEKNDSEKDIFKSISQHYEDAAKIVAESNDLEKSSYVEALVNLAFLKLQPHIGNSSLLIERSIDANKYLEQAKKVCEKKDKKLDIDGYFPDTTTCLIVHYSQGVVQQNLTQYDESIVAFNKALAHLEEISKDKANFTDTSVGVFRSKLYHSLTYSYIKLSEENPTDYLAKAKLFLGKTKQTNTLHNLIKPSVNILSARINIIENKWPNAIANLEASKQWADDNDHADYYLLSAIVEKCLSSQNFTESLNKYLAKKILIDGESSQHVGYFYYNNKTIQCNSDSY